MLIKAAITGTHGTGKTTMTGLVVEKATKAGWNALVVSSTTREVLRLGERYGLGNNKDGDFRFQLTNAMAMQLRQWEVGAEADRLARVTMLPTLVVGDRCLLDSLSYTKDLLYRSEDRTGSPPFRSHRSNLLAGTYDLTREITAIDIPQYWDLVAYKPPHLDHLDGDDDRLDDRQYQLDVAGIARRHFEQLVPPEMQHELDPDLHVAADQLWDAVLSVAEAREPVDAT